MVKIILCVVISLICAAFMQNENYFYTTTDKNEEWSPKSRSNSSWVNRLSDKEKYIKWQACYKNAFFVDTNNTRSKTFECLDLLDEISNLPYVIFLNSSSGEFSINTTLLNIHVKNEFLTENDSRILRFFFKVIPHRVLVNIFEDVVKIINDAINVKQLSHRLCRIFIHFLLNAIDTDLLAITSKLVVATWRPFLSNFTGVHWIKTMNNGVENQVKRINCTSYYELSQLNINRTEMRACVHPLFLNELGLTLSEEDKKKLYVVLILSVDNPFFAEYFYGDAYYTESYNGDNRVVGFSIPGYCKQIYQPLLNISFDGVVNNVFGKEYFDLIDVWYKECSVSKMVFVDRVQTIKNSTMYYESVKEEYCSEETTIEGFNKVHWSRTPLFSMGYPDSFCIDSNYRIPFRRCGTHGFANNSQVECFQAHVLSVNSKIFYEYATKCNRFESFSVILQHFNSSVLNKLDQYLYLMAIRCIFNNMYICDPHIYEHWCDNFNKEMHQNLDLIHTTLNAGIDIAYKRHRDNLVIFFVLICISWIQDHWMREGMEIYPRYMYYKQQGYPFRMVIFKGDGNSFSNSRVEVSTKEIDATDEYIFNANAEVIININSTPYYQMKSVTVLVLYDSLFWTYKGFVCRSRMVVLFSGRNNRNLIMKLYLKIINFNDNQTMISHTGEGHWIEIPNITMGQTRVAIYEKNDNYCIGESFALIHSWFGNSDFLKTKKRLQEPIDLLSAVSFSINTADTIEKIKQIYHKHTLTLNILRRTGGTLSSIGIFFIFSTTFILNGWQKTRFNIIQLTTTLASQLPFFLLDMEVSHVKILIFYYCILCQFSCTSIIGYVQYTKYIAVFKNRPAGRLKSLIIGWVIPLKIILSSLFFYSDCLKCHLCHKNKEIFMFFVFVPIVTIIVGNSIVYIVAMINIWSSPKVGSHDIKLRIKVSIFLPCVLGITWIFIAALVAPWSWLPLLGLFLIHLVLPSQGFLLFVFVILLDEVTRDQWKNYLGNIRRKRINPTIELIELN